MDNRTTHPGTRVLLAIGALALIAIAGTVVGLAVTRQRTYAWLLDSREVVHLAQSALTETADETAAIDDYLLSGKPSTTPPAQRILATIDSAIRLTAGTPLLETDARAFRTAAEHWISAVAAPAVTVASREAARQFVEATAARVARSDIDARAGALLVDEEQMYNDRFTRLQRRERGAAALIVAETLLIFGILAQFGRRIKNQVATLVDRRAQLERQAAAMEQQAAELEASNRALGVALDASHHASALLEAALAGAPIGLAFVDRDLRYIRVNEMYAKITGLPPEEHVGRARLDIVPPEGGHADTLTPLLEHVLETREPILNYPYAGPLPTRPDERHYWMLSYYPIVLRDGTVAGVGMSVVDVTDQRRLTEQLVQAQKMEAVGRLAGGVAHDFNNILAVISGYAEVVLAMETSVEVRTDLEEIRMAALRGTALTRQLLTFTRKQIVQVRTVSLNEIIDRMRSMISRLVHANIEVVTVLREDAGMVVSDTSQVEQIIMNLVVNASDAMPDGGMLTLETANIDLDDHYASSHPGVTAGSYTMIAVSDTGIGMDAQTISRVFEPYFTTKEMGRGTGLGLSTVYAITRQIGGHVWVYSEPGRGATFKVYLPRVAGPIPVAAPDARAATPVRPGTETVLLVEDDPQVRRALRRMLEQSGYLVIEASDGTSALEAAAATTTPIQVVLTDLMMPGMNGRALADELAKRWPTLRLVFMSGYTSDAVVRRGIVDSAHAFLQKPVTMDELRRTMRAVLDGA